MNGLVIAPHADDEVLGPGGTIAHLVREGCRVTVCIVTSPYTPEWSRSYIRHKQLEIAKAHKILGVAETVQLGLPTVKLDECSQKKLNDLLSTVVRRVKPHIMLIPHAGDVNMDHRLIHVACLVACRPVNGHVRRLLAYETLSETEWGSPINPTFYMRLSVPDYRKKEEAMSAYMSELRKWPHPRSLLGILSLAQKRGCEVNTGFAEAFQVVREVQF